jgi:formylglycine-generating enzyme required for sulfatase activity
MRINISFIIFVLLLSGCSPSEEPGYTLPTQPNNPKPENGAIGISTAPTLNWYSIDYDGDAVTFSIYVDTINPPMAFKASLRNAGTLSLSGLLKNQTYYWKVNAKDYKDSTLGPVWSFTTGIVDNNPPTEPVNPSPAIGSVNIQITPSFSWSSKDPDGEAITYDLYLDSNNTPTTKIAVGLHSSFFWQYGLSHLTTYYWRVIAKDSKGAITNGPVWNFTTGERPVAPVLIPVDEGTFMVETTRVTISNFKIDKYEVTYELWTEVRDWALAHGYVDLGRGDNGRNPDGTNNPIVSVNWYDVVKWCNARSEKENLTPVYYTRSEQDTVYRTKEIGIINAAVKWNANGYRLPTEAEWEFAAHGGNLSHGYTYSGSNTLNAVAWVSSNSNGRTHSVGKKSANELGIYDMSGNAFEWCWDWFDTTYPYGDANNPKGPSTKQYYRTARGGSFDDFDYNCRVHNRGPYSPVIQYSMFGFRCVRK